MSPATKHRRFGSDDDIDVENQAPGGDIEVNEANDTGHAVDSDSASDDDAPPEIVSLEQGKEIEQARLEKGQELTRSRKAAKKAVEAAKQAEAERLTKKHQKKIERSIAKNLKRKKRLEALKAESGSEDEDNDDDVTEGYTRNSTQQLHQEDEIFSLSVTAPRLPDAIFAAAAKASLHTGDDDHSLSSVESLHRPAPAKRRRKVKKPTDLIVGSRTVRPLAAASQIGMASSLQPSKANKSYVTRRLSTQKERKDKYWRRRSGSGWKCSSELPLD